MKPPYIKDPDKKCFCAKCCMKMAEKISPSLSDSLEQVSIEIFKRVKRVSVFGCKVNDPNDRSGFIVIHYFNGSARQVWNPDAAITLRWLWKNRSKFTNLTIN